MLFYKLLLFHAITTVSKSRLIVLMLFYKLLLFHGAVVKTKFGQFIVLMLFYKLLLFHFHGETTLHEERKKKC